MEIFSFLNMTALLILWIEGLIEDDSRLKHFRRMAAVWLKGPDNVRRQI